MIICDRELLCLQPGASKSRVDKQSGQLGYHSMLRAKVQQNGHVRLAMERIRTGKAVTGKLIAWDHRPSTPAGQTNQPNVYTQSSRLVTDNSAAPGRNTYANSGSAWQPRQIVFTLCSHLQQHRIGLDLTDVQLCGVTPGKWQPVFQGL